jgi:hypothetical protein
VDSVNASTDILSRKQYQNKAGIRDSIDLSSEEFVLQVQNWIRFIRATASSQNHGQDDQISLLFNLLLHDQIVPFYDESVSNRFADSRLIEHFKHWLASQDATLVLWDDQCLDQAQEFIAWEKYHTFGLPSKEWESGYFELGYSKALLATQRWVREYTARKRLFTTSLGYVGIGWHSLRKGDQIVQIPGLKSRLLIRRINDAGSDMKYRSIRPCNVPQPQTERESVVRDAKHIRFKLV